MKQASLRTLLRLRQAAVDEARVALASCLAAETAAREALRELDAAVARETDAAMRLEAEDRAVEEFAAWLRRVRAERSQGERVLASAEARSAEARSVLSVTMVAAGSLEELLAQHDAAALVAAEARDRRDLDDAASRVDNCELQPRDVKSERF